MRRNLNDAYRDRIEAELNKTDIGKDRLGRANDRLVVKIDEMIEEMADGPKHPKTSAMRNNKLRGRYLQHQPTWRTRYCWKSAQMQRQKPEFPHGGQEITTLGPQTDLEETRGQVTPMTWMKTSTRPAGSIRRLRRG